MLHWMSLLCCFAFLTACGNGNDGRKFGSKKANNSTATITQDTSLNSNSPNLSSCKVMTVLNGSSPDFAQIFAGSSVCRINGGSPGARLKVSGQFPTNSRFCLVPWNNGTAYPESCFVINGQADIGLDPSSGAYTSLVLLAESDLPAYKAYVAYQSNNDPPRALAQMQ